MNIIEAILFLLILSPFLILLLASLVLLFTMATELLIEALKEFWTTLTRKEA